MSRFKYFELHEFIRSDTARKRGVDNSPTFEVVEHLSELVDKILDPLRSAYGYPITVTSGYRCDELNKAVGGVDSSSHPLGYAADLQVGGSFKKFCDFVTEWVKKTGVKFDQIIIESDKSGNQWLHIGLYNASGQQRGQIKTIQA